MEKSLPKNAWKFIGLINLAWWSLPLGLTLEFMFNVDAYTLSTDADSPALFLIPMYGIWFFLCLCLNIFLILKKKSYPPEAPLFGWNPIKLARSWLWTIVCGLFVSIYVYLIINQLISNAVNLTISIGAYIPLALYIYYSLQLRAMLVCSKS